MTESEAYDRAKAETERQYRTEERDARRPVGMNGYLNEARDIVKELADLECEFESDGALVFVDSADLDRLVRIAREWSEAEKEFKTSLRRKS